MRWINAGQKPRLLDPATGALVPVELFVAVLGASNCTYAEATHTQQDSWPGNVRELSNVIERAVLLSDSAVIPAETLQLPRAPSEKRPPSMPLENAEPERRRPRCSCSRP